MKLLSLERPIRSQLRRKYRFAPHEVLEDAWAHARFAVVKAASNPVIKIRRLGAFLAVAARRHVQSWLRSAAHRHPHVPYAEERDERRTEPVEPEDPDPRFWSTLKSAIARLPTKQRRVAELLVEFDGELDRPRIHAGYRDRHGDPGSVQSVRRALQVATAKLAAALALHGFAPPPVYAFGRHRAARSA